MSYISYYLRTKYVERMFRENTAGQRAARFGVAVGQTPPFGAAAGQTPFRRAPPGENDSPAELLYPVSWKPRAPTGDVLRTVKTGPDFSGKRDLPPA